MKAEHACKVVLLTEVYGVLDVRTDTISAAEDFVYEILLA